MSLTIKQQQELLTAAVTDTKQVQVCTENGWENIPNDHEFDFAGYEYKVTKRPNNYGVVAGDWCLFWDNESKQAILRRFMGIHPRTNLPRDDLGNMWSYCQKFDGTLPPQFKDLK